MTSNRSDAISFVGLTLLYGYFGYGVIDGGLDQPGLVGRTLAFYILVAVVMAFIQIVAALALGKEAEPRDREIERDIGRRAGRNAWVTIVGGLWAVPLLLGLPEMGVNLAIFACVGLLGLSEVVRYGSKLAYRGLGALRNQRALAS